MELSVVVPVLNEAGNIRPLVAEIHAALEGLCEFEVLFVDDGSEDATAAELAAECRRYPRLRFVRHGKRCGQSTALCSGIQGARGTWIATLDGDGQNDPADIPRLWEAARRAGTQTAPMLVAGYRRQRSDSRVKRYSSRIANAVRARFLGDATPDTGCGLKVFRRDAFLRLPHFDHMHRFLPALFRRAGGDVASLEVNHRHRLRGRSKYGTLDRLVVGVVDLVGVMWLQRRACVPEIRRRSGGQNAVD
jgi:dolichol-phosphate mannosyltransferase